MRKAYLIIRDGFILLAIGFTSKRDLEFKLKYIEAPNAMKKSLLPITIIEALELALIQDKEDRNKESIDLGIDRKSRLYKKVSLALSRWL